MLRQRKLSYDVIRTIAILMIVMVHVSSYVVTWFNAETANSTFVVGNIFNGLSRAGTPLFLMLSGALLLDEDRQISAREFYRRKFLPICLLLVFWLLFYAVWRAVITPLIMGNPIDFKEFFDYLLWQTGRFNHLWYLFMLIGAYLVIPILRLFVKRENKKYILGLIILNVIVQFIVQTAGVFTLDMKHTVGEYISKFHVEYATGYIPYLLIGWYLMAFPLKRKIKIILEAAGLIALLAIVLVVQFQIGNIPTIRVYVSEMNTLPAMLYGVGVFLLVTDICGERKTKTRAGSFLPQMSFGVYVMHVFVLDILIKWAIPYKAFHEQNPLLYILILFVLDFGITLLLTFGLTRIPGVKKLLKG